MENYLLCSNNCGVEMPLITSYNNTSLQLYFKHLFKSLPVLHNMFNFSAFSYIWLPLVSLPTCSSLVQEKMYSWVRNWRAGSTTEAVFELCGTGQLSPLFKQQTTSVCQHPDPCVCLGDCTSALDKSHLQLPCSAWPEYHTSAYKF